MKALLLVLIATAHLTAPVRFEENRGQSRADVRYIARGRPQPLYFTDREAIAGVVRISFPGSNPYQPVVDRSLTVAAL